MDREKRFVAIVTARPGVTLVLLVVLALALGFVAGRWFRTTTPPPRPTSGEISRRLERVGTLEGCLQKDLCGESSRSNERTFDEAHTQGHEQLNAQLREALQIARDNPALLASLKRDLSTRETLVKVGNEETSQVLGDVMLADPVAPRDVAFLLEAARESGASDVMLRAARQSNASADVKHLVVDEFVRLMRENSAQLEEVLSGIGDTSLDAADLTRLAREACAYQRNPLWRQNWPWVSHHLQNALRARGVGTSVDEVCRGRTTP
jgi:hypothetical protein